MRRRVLLCLTLIFAMSACNGDRIGTPIGSPGSNTKLIVDGTDADGNPDFFFLPPMVKQPGTGSPWNVGAFNPNLRPTVVICDFGPTTSAPLPAASCTAPTSYAAVVSITDEHYKVNWKVPTSDTKYFRIIVKVGDVSLGFADVESDASGASLKKVNTLDVVQLGDGRTLPIKFRIEQFALCAVPGVGPCTSASADISTTPITVSTGTPSADASGISTSAGVTIPAQGGATPIPVTVTLATCADLSEALRRRTVGQCISVTTRPVLEAPLAPRATVFICEVGIGAYGLTEADEAAIKMYRSDDAGIVALQSAPACKPGSPGGLLASATPSVRGMFASLLHGKFRHAADEALALVTPKPLYAAMFIDLGGGGFTESFSDFQFAVPSVLIYGPTLFTALNPSRPINEKTLAEAAGYDVTVWDATTWASKSAADFAKFSAVIFPDAFNVTVGDCATNPSLLATAEANTATWSPSVNGPAVIIGTDPIYHSIDRPQAVTMMSNAIKFAVSSTTKTGLYAALSCYYGGATAPTQVAFLNGIGDFKVVGQSGLSQTATIVNPSHPVTAGLSGSGLSNWNLSVHEAFPILNSYPSNFGALATIFKSSTEENLPYIIARP